MKNILRAKKVGACTVALAMGACSLLTAVPGNPKAAGPPAASTSVKITSMDQTAGIVTFGIGDARTDDEFVAQVVVEGGSEGLLEPASTPRETGIHY